MANYEDTRYDFDGAYLQGVEGVNTGLIVPWSSLSIPSGFLECDGSAVSRSTYATLFAVVGTTWGVGDGSTTFNIPDLTDRCCSHSSPTKTFATTGGANTVSSTGTIGGSIGNTTIDTPTLPSHTHGWGWNTGQGGSLAVQFRAFTYSSNSTGGGGAHSHPLSSASFTGDATSVLQPYITMVYIIKT